MRKPKTQNQPHPISEALRDLRTALGDSQQDFAYRMKTAIRTISRWETIQPPRGPVLLKFIALAQKANRPDVATLFQRAHTAELELDPFNFVGKAHYEHGHDGSYWGFLLQWFEGQEQARYGQAFQAAFMAVTRPESYANPPSPETIARARQALEDLAKVMAEWKGSKRK